MTHEERQKRIAEDLREIERLQAEEKGYTTRKQERSKDDKRSADRRQERSKDDKRSTDRSDRKEDSKKK